MKKWGIALIFPLLMSGCSTQNREAAPQVDDAELFELFSEIKGQVSDQIVASFATESLTDSNAAILYHARDSAGRPAVSILAVADMGVFFPAKSGQHSLDVGLNKVDAFFLDSIDANNQRHFSLMLRVEIEGESAPIYFAGSSASDDYQFDDTTLEVYIPGNNGVSLILQTNDLSEKYDEELADSIKLNIYLDRGGAGAEYIGQISTMAGYGNR